MNLITSTLFLILLLLRPCSTSTEKSLLDHLLANYSSLERPVKNVSSPVVVTMGFNLIQIMSIVEKVNIENIL